MRYPSEAVLLHRYDANPGYYTPLKDDGFVLRLLHFAGAELDLNKVLDVGCGDGRLGVELHKLGIRTDGFDASPVRVQLAQDTGAGNYVCGDLYALLDEDGPYHLDYDFVFAIEVLEHLENPTEAIRLARQWAPLVGTVPLKWPFPMHLQLYERPHDVQQKLNPDRMERYGRHMLCFWEQQS
jgi:SAM-dependent methyltransferase